MQNFGSYFVKPFAHQEWLESKAYLFHYYLLMTSANKDGKRIGNFGKVEEDKKKHLDMLDMPTSILEINVSDSLLGRHRDTGRRELDFPEMKVKNL